jgi:(R,R)-butanediol dehydrogenase / meso-butanediol dehydrogenase / diacetyl reductase
MLAARFYGARDIRLEEVPVPQVRQPDDVLVEISYCGICGTDLHEYLMGPIVTSASPHPLTGATIPQTLGHEFSGTVTEVGRDVTTVKPGDRVSVCPIITCGRCYHCRRGNGQLCFTMACTGLSAETGALANFAVVKEVQVAVLPDGVSDLEGAVIEPACVAAYGVDWAGVTGGDIVLVTGAGPIGVLSAMYASAIGAATVVIAEPNPNRAALARAMDIGPVIDPTDAGFADAIGDLTAGIGVDLAVECSGTAPGLTTAITSTRARGQVVQTGLHTAPAAVDMMLVANKEISVKGSWCYNLTDWPRVIRLVAAGKFPVAQAVTTTIGLPDVVTKGFDVLVDPQGDQLKVLVSSK